MTLLLCGGVIGAGLCVLVWMIWLVPERSTLIVALGTAEQRCAQLQGTVARDVVQLRQLSDLLGQRAGGRVPGGPLRLLPRFPIPAAAIDHLVSTNSDEVVCALVRWQYDRSTCFSIACDRCNGHPLIASKGATVDAG